MTMANEMQDVLVIGGGPAGSTSASRLAMKGHSVTLFEKEKFPREHVGESLLPFCYWLFQDLGVLDQLTQRFVRKPGVRFINSDGSNYTSWCFDHVIKDPSYLSFQVVRSEFDQILLNNARSKGVTVHEETRVKSVDLNAPDGGVELVAVGPDGAEQRYRARYLVDASGRDSFVATRNGWRKPHQGLERTSLWTHWGGIKQLSGGLEEGLSIIIYLGGEKRGWIWVFPLGANELTIGVVMDTASLRQGRHELEAAGAESWRVELYMREIMLSEVIRKLLDGAHMTKPLMVEADYSYFSENKYGVNYTMVGDASRFIDPIFSSGIYLAMKSSFLLADAISTKLTGADFSDNTPMDQAFVKINGAYDVVHRLIRLYYNPHAINFAEAGVALQMHKQHENALAAGHYLLSGDFFERHEEYSKFIDLLQDQNMFKAYKSFVIDRKQYQASSCHTTPALVFPTQAAPVTE